MQYLTIVSQKPISEYYHYNDFLDAVEAYEIDLEDNRLKAASDIVKKVLKNRTVIIHEIYSPIKQMYFSKNFLLQILLSISVPHET